MAVKKITQALTGDSDIGTPGGDTLQSQRIAYTGVKMTATCEGVVYAERVVTLSIPAFTGAPADYTSWAAAVAIEEQAILDDIDDAFGEGS
jgi:hypothetical protein